MNHVMKLCLPVVFSMVTVVSAASADELFKLSNNQRIACSRGLAAGKLNDNKEVINVQADGSCAKKPRIFDADSNYTFDATETEPPNTNSFFGTGGYSIWAADTTQQKVRGCIVISSGLGSDVSKCLDMTFQ